jgi:hypothetical protein
VFDLVVQATQRRSRRLGRRGCCGRSAPAGAGSPAVLPAGGSACPCGSGRTSSPCRSRRRLPRALRSSRLGCAILVAAISPNSPLFARRPVDRPRAGRATPPLRSLPLVPSVVSRARARLLDSVPSRPSRAKPTARTESRRESFGGSRWPDTDAAGHGDSGTQAQPTPSHQPSASVTGGASSDTDESIGPCGECPGHPGSTLLSVARIGAMRPAWALSAKEMCCRGGGGSGPRRWWCR